ncbi:alpha/beta hydrolase [Nocardia sp. NPDC049149]|uniref:alpha/beta hydrolase n=1 Tax=Nocardia sp. NPDC049149 TaxID=3364315 RepID=UPI00371CE6E2
MRDSDARFRLKIGGGVALAASAAFLVWADDEEPDKPARSGTAADAVRVNEWWNSLTLDEQRRLLAEDFERIGNLNGIPVEVRDAANRRAMEADIRRVEDIAKSKDVPVEMIDKDPKKFGLTVEDVSRYRNAVNVRAGLDNYSRAGDAGKYPPTPYPTYLYVYQPLAFGGDGRAAISIGNPDTARNTAVVVPGASQSVRASDASGEGWFVAQGDQARNLYVESNRADPNSPTAVVAWMGYDSPADGLSAVVRGDPTAERIGGNLLAEDVDGLWATHQGPSHLTVVGYSAGAIVAADAAAGSQLHANDVVLLGPVSTDEARSAADFRVDGGHVYIGKASNDLNAHAGQAWLGGPDPIDRDYGATRIKAEAPESYSSPIDYSMQAHLHYFTAGSESLYATALVASGNADRLGQDGMLAEPKEEIPYWPDNDPEGARTDIQDDHYHGPR